ncbi:MAG: NAD(P)/FAD-dependent oxidoreductase, partial [Halobacteriaceae archaeon]
FPSKFQNAVANQLERIGVNIHTNCEITAANKTSVTVHGDSEIEYGEFIWTGGIQGPQAVNEASRPEIRADLRYKTNTFMAGDCAHVIDNEGKRVPASAQAAVQQGKVVATNIHRCIQSDRSNELPKLERFRFNAPGWAVSIGDTAVAIIGSSIVTGKPAQVMKATAGIRYLATAGNISESLGLLREEIYL